MIFKKILVNFIVLFIGLQVMKEVLYEYHIKNNDKIKAFLIKPFYFIKSTPNNHKMN